MNGCMQFWKVLSEKTIMTKEYVIALDQGTTTSRAVLVNKLGQVVGISQQPFTQYYPEPGWVEHDPNELLSSQLSALTQLLVENNIEPDQIDSIGIANQRETVVVWDKNTGKPVCNAIVWQCRRTAALIEEISSDETIRATIIEKTGLIPDAYFSASKIRWILDEVDGARNLAEQGRLAFGTIDSWLIWSLTQGAVHATDTTNASRTMLFNIHEGVWDDWLLHLFDIPRSMLPEVRPSSSCFGFTSHSNIIEGIPICGVAGDQQAALFGQACFSAGQAKNTYGTGCFLLMHTGTHACTSTHGLITTIAASAKGSSDLEYALEGSVFVAGALVQWLRDELQLIDTAESTEALAYQVEDTGGVFIVPAFTGLGAPYWDSDARGLISGITRGTNKAHIVRAALESMAFQVNDLVEAMKEDAQVDVETLHVDGGASDNNFLMQFQSDLLNATLIRPSCVESTALGAAFLSGLSTGFWKDKNELQQLCRMDRKFEPALCASERAEYVKAWHNAVKRAFSSRESD